MPTGLCHATLSVAVTSPCSHVRPPVQSDRSPPSITLTGWHFQKGDAVADCQITGNLSSRVCVFFHVAVARGPETAKLPCYVRSLSTRVVRRSTCPAECFADIVRMRVQIFAHPQSTDSADGTPRSERTRCSVPPGLWVSVVRPWRCVGHTGTMMEKTQGGYPAARQIPRPFTPQKQTHVDVSRSHLPNLALTVAQQEARLAMKILGCAAYLLLLGGMCCQSNRSVKPSGKTTKKVQGNQGADAVHPAPGEETQPGPVELGKDGTSGARPAVQPSAAQSNKPSDDMKLIFLKNAQVTCNDGSAAGVAVWRLRILGMISFPVFIGGRPSPIGHPRIFVPYCSSDVWSGTGPVATKEKKVPGKEKDDYTFMGSLIIREVIKDLVPKGIKQAKVVMLAGTSAGGTGVLLNIEKVSSQLELLGAEAQVRGLVDSSWFLESKQQRVPEPPDNVSFSPVDSIKKGLKLWNGVVPDKCQLQYKKGEEWQCFFGHKLYSSLSSPLFVVQWLFDEEQLRVENIYLGGQTLSEQQWIYMQNLGKELKNSLKDVTAVFAPSCLSHTLITKSNWMTFQVKGTSLPRALQCWDKSFQEANRNSKTPLKGCPFNLIDTCQSPQCNPTCPALVDQATQQELTLLQLLVGMGLDLQKLGQEPQSDASSRTSMAGNGG
ncbi:hypothetical protein DPEC_G00173480 [Dallia pectoralis]|uniref:Uncharacterized protein n=1 Tax=Dallia pectoralis TaxID=75939 RepID=A0ACC2GDM2_DALPE|nr:hypothetical protein DPEC_G00173480 [Dallia pectoralis]